jgi:ribulose-bisphosphate carboxylase large chain
VVEQMIRVTYRAWTDDPVSLAEAIRVEQSIEFPFELAAEWIQKEVVGQVESISKVDEGSHEICILFDERDAGGELPQLLNVIWGNVSMFVGVRIVGLEIPPRLLSKFKGPRFGISGLREMFGAPSRGLVSTALKPMGSSPKEFAEMATVLTSAGFDTIKDDHSLANQPWAKWRDRVSAVSEAVAEANLRYGTHCLYAPSLQLPTNEIVDAAREAKELGATSLMVLPGIAGFDSLRMVAEDDSISLPIMGHPSMLGSFVTPEKHGIRHGIVHSTLMRLAGADITIFPNFGGRFSYSMEQCLEIARDARSEMGHIKPAWISPAGGMSIDRLADMFESYGKDTAALVGGALHRGNLAENAKTMVETIHAL